LNGAQHATGAARTAALRKLATELDHDVTTASDAKRVHALASVVKRMETTAR
jgi:hypothetical protein